MAGKIEQELAPRTPVGLDPGDRIPADDDRDPAIEEGPARPAVATSHPPILRPMMPELDSLRGIAVLVVVFYHGFFWSIGIKNFSGLTKSLVDATRYGWLGVNLFFVLSGFLITGILVDSRRHPHFFRRFYVRRVLRILPAFYLTIAILAFTPRQSASYLWLSFFHLSNVATLFGVPMTYAMFWSLAVEEHFYLVWPFVARRLRPARLLACAVGIAVVVTLMRWVLYGSTYGNAYLTWTVADGLAIGAAVALFVRLTSQDRRSLLIFSSITGGVAVAMLVIGTPFGILSRQNVVGWVFMLTAAHLLFAGALGVTLLVGTSRFKALVNWPVLRFFGGISYGLYLIHWFAFMTYDRISWSVPAIFPAPGRFDLAVLRFVAAGGFATLLAFVSRRYFEEKFLRMKERLGA